MGIIHFSCPEIQAINTHGKIICIDNQIAQQPINEQQIDEKSRTDDACGINQNIVEPGKPRAYNSEENRQEFNDDQVSRCIRIFRKEPIKNGVHNCFGRSSQF